jgi:hypothetical protein
MNVRFASTSRPVRLVDDFHILPAFTMASSEFSDKSDTIAGWGRIPILVRHKTRVGSKRQCPADVQRDFRTRVDFRARELLPVETGGCAAEFGMEPQQFIERLFIRSKGKAPVESWRPQGHGLPPAIDPTGSECRESYHQRCDGNPPYFSRSSLPLRLTIFL